MKQTKIIIADDHEVVIDGLTALLASEPDMDVIGKALNGERVLELLKNKSADLILMDIDMPGMGGIEASRQVKKAYPSTKVVMLTMYDKRKYVSQAMQVGADGYLLKNTNKNDLMKGIREVLEGQFVVSPDIDSSPVTPANDQPQLTDREIEIMCLIAQEYTSQEIGEKLFIAPTTVEKHRSNIFAKLGVKNVVGLVRYAFEHDLCDLRG